MFADGDAGTAAAMTMGTVTLGLSGQVCLAQTRALVHRDKVEEFLGMAEVIAGMVSYGNPFDPAVTASPLINTRQLDRVLGLIARARRKAPGWSAAVPAATATWRPATSWRRRCSPTCTTT